MPDIFIPPSERYKDVPISSSEVIIVYNGTDNSGHAILDVKPHNSQDDIEAPLYFRALDILDAARRKDLIQKFDAELKTALDGDNHLKIARELNKAMLDDAPSHSRIAKALSTQNLEPETLQALTPFLYPGIAYYYDFTETIQNLPEFKTKTGANLLHNILCNEGPLPNMEEAVIKAFGFSPDNPIIGNIAYLSFQSQLVVVNELFLQKNLQEKYDIEIRAYEEMINDIHDVLTKKDGVLETSFGNRKWDLPSSSVKASLLTPETARDKFNNIIEDIEKNLPTEQARNAYDFIASSLHEKRDVVFVDASEATAMNSQKRECGGFSFMSDSSPPNIYIAVKRSHRHTIDTFLEEAAHGAIGDLYGNNQVPYKDEADPRKALLEKAIEADSFTSTRKERLLLSKNFYSDEEQPAEIPVKILKQMVQGTWTKEDEKRFPHCTQFVEEVILTDFKHKEQYGELSKEPALKDFTVKHGFGAKAELVHDQIGNKIENNLLAQKLRALEKFISTRLENNPFIQKATYQREIALDAVTNSTPMLGAKNTLNNIDAFYKKNKTSISKSIHTTCIAIGLISVTPSDINNGIVNAAQITKVNILTGITEETTSEMTNILLAEKQPIDTPFTHRRFTAFTHPCHSK
jgi:hypothetical protein